MSNRLACCVAVALALVGCGSLEIRPASDGWPSFATHARAPDQLAAQLAGAPLCCASLAELPWQKIDTTGVVAARIDTDSPAFRFAGGKSYFAAFDIRQLPRPLSITLASRRTAEAGTVGRLLPDFRQLVFAPQALILNENFAVERAAGPGRPLEGCATNARADVYATTIDIGEPPAAAAYLVVATSDALREADGERICGIHRHGLSPIGEIALRVVDLDFSDGAIALKLPAKWHAGARGVHDIGAFAGLLSEPGLLLLGESAVHYLEPEGFRYRLRLRLPYERIVSARAGDFTTPLARYLVLETRGPADRNSAFDSFESVRVAGETFVSAPEIIARLNRKIRPGQRIEPIEFDASERPPALELLAAERGALGRIGQAAMSGGAITAFPCALCQTGACTPDILLSCAALFSVGALIGGVGSGASELVATLRGSPAEAAPRAETLRQSINPLVEAASREHFGRRALLRCIADELGDDLGDGGGAAWHDQGRVGRPGTASVGKLPAEPPDEAAQGLVFHAESSILRLALRAENASGAPSPPSEPRLRLLIEGELRVADRSRGQKSVFELRWESAAHAPADWVENGPSLVPEALREGCRALAGQIVRHVRQAWKR